MKLIVGLGNYGNQYDNTRHNVGFLIVDNIINLLKLSYKEEPSAFYATTKINGEKIIFAKPKLFMNNSGKVIKGMSSYFKIDIEDIFIIVDDKDQEIGKFKIIKNSGHGGQNGVRDIIENFKSKDFSRLKIGIGSDPKINTANYVLGKWTKHQKDIIDKNISIYSNIALDFIELPYEKLTNKYNGKN